MTQPDLRQTTRNPLADLTIGSGGGDFVASRLRQIHERAAQVTEARNPQSVAEIAIHYDRSGNTDKAYQYALQVAAQAAAAYRYQEAAAFLEIAERHATTPPRVAEVRARRAAVAEAMGRYEVAEELCALAMDAFNGFGERRRALYLRRARERLRGLLGQSAQVTLGACLALEAEAQELGADDELVALRTMVSELHERLGQRDLAERTAREAVRVAEVLADGLLLAESLTRLAGLRRRESTLEAIELYTRALQLFQAADNRRGEAKSRNNLGVTHMTRGAWTEARQSFETGITVARASGLTEQWAVGLLNLGVVGLRTGEYQRAREQFNEAFALFAALHNRTRELIAVYNLARLERECREDETAIGLYETASALAISVGQSDIEIGSLGGMGLAQLRLGRIDSARASLRSAEKRLRPRAEWFNGRESAEALIIGVAAADGRGDEALRRFDHALDIAQASDAYSAIWLVAECAPMLMSYDAARLRDLVGRTLKSIDGAGYAALEARLRELLG